MRLFSLPHVIDSSAPPFFPDNLRPDAHGLVAVGGDLSEPVVLEAYSRGIFPWYNQPPLMWYSPDPRMVLYPRDYHVPERLDRVIRQRRFQVVFDRDFDQVIQGCAAVPRPRQEGTWIGEDFVEAYTALHHGGWAHCVTAYSGGEVAGGLYGLAIGRVFCGESMFALEPNASKVAFAWLMRFITARDFAFVDCQAPTPHLASLGAVEVPRRRFLSELAFAVAAPSLRGSWTDLGAALGAAPGA